MDSNDREETPVVPTHARLHVGVLPTLATLLAVTVFAAAAGAATTYVIDQENTGVYGTGGGHSTQLTSYAQGFTPQLPYLGGIEVEVGCCPAGPGLSSTVRLDIREGGIAGPVVGSSEIVVLDGVFTFPADGMITGLLWPFSPALHVQPGALYVYEVVIVAGSSISLAADQLGLYPGGNAYANGLPIALDFVFRTGGLVADPKIYWADTSLNRVDRADLDGANAETIATGLTINGVAVDPANSVLYWLECCGALNGKVRRADLDGGGEADVPTGATFGFPQRITVDSANQTLYWTDSSLGVVLRANTDGLGLVTLVGPDAARSPTGIALDPVDEKVYWTESSGANRGIHRMDFSGANQEPLLLQANGDPIGQPEGISIDPVEGRMYWTDLGLDAIRRADLDGSNIELIADFVSHGLQNPIGIVVDPLAGELYYGDTTNDEITRMDLTGSSPVDILTGLSFPRGIDIVPVVVPEPDAWLTLAAGCGLLARLTRRAA